jgi:hypothetical protein
MAKPVITKRIDKGAALTYNELDTNFQNIIDSILTVTDGVSDIDLELIDTLEFTGDHNIKITATPSGNIVTVDNEIPVITKEPTGFENLEDSSLAFDDATRTFTITLEHPEDFAVFVAGEEFLKTASESIEIPDVTDLYLIVYDAVGDLQYKTGYLDFDAEAPVAHVYWNATTGLGRLAEQRHGITLDWATHEYLHRTRGAAYASGLAISNYTTSGNGSSNSHAQFDLSNGTFFDEDLKFDITHSNSPTDPFQQDLQGPARIPVAYHLGAAGVWTFDTATDYAVKSGTARITYNLNTAGTWTTPNIPNTHYMAMWIIATNFISEPIIAIMGQRTDNKLDDALNNNTYANLDLTNFPSEEFRPLYRIIFRGADSYTNTPKAYIAAVTDFRTVTVGGGTAASVTPNNFGIIAVTGQDPVIADTSSDTLTLVAGTGITITTDDAADSVTIAAIGSGSVNSGAANALAYYPSAGTTVDDTDLVTVDSSGIIVGNNGLLSTIRGSTSNTNGLSLIGGASGSQHASIAIRKGDISNNADITLLCSGNGTIDTYSTGLFIGTVLNSGDNVISTYNNNSDKLILKTNNNANIELAPAGTGDVLLSADTIRIGDQNAAATLTTWGTGDLILSTNNGTNSGTITITDGVDGDITIASNGDGDVIIDGEVQINATTNLTPVDDTTPVAWMEIGANGNTYYIPLYQ